MFIGFIFKIRISKIKKEDDIKPSSLRFLFFFIVNRKNLLLYFVQFINAGYSLNHSAKLPPTFHYL